MLLIRGNECLFIFTALSNIFFISIRFEWQHRGSAHIHGFLWLEGDPDVERLNWLDLAELQVAKRYFDRILIAWNPRDIHRRNTMVPRGLTDDPCLLNTDQIFASNPLDDYEHLVNRVQRHSKCSPHSCLWKKGAVLVCRYNTPWELREKSMLHKNEKGQKKNMTLLEMMIASTFIMCRCSQYGEWMWIASLFFPIMRF